MTQPSPHPHAEPPADEQETLRLPRPGAPSRPQERPDQPDPDATRPMSLAELRELD